MKGFLILLVALFALFAYYSYARADSATKTTYKSNGEVCRETCWTDSFGNENCREWCF